MTNKFLAIVCLILCSCAKDPVSMASIMMWCALITRDAQERGILAEFVGPETIDGTGRFLGMLEAP
jgi:hypothetical protein